MIVLKISLMLINNEYEYTKKYYTLYIQKIFYKHFLYLYVIYIMIYTINIIIL